MDERKAEYPIVRFWYSKAARFKSIEELIDKDPTWFIWAVERFQDVTPKQAAYFKERWGMDLPEEVIGDVIPYEHKKGSPDKEYEELCERYAAEKERNKKRSI